jgi:hypothetical protein
MVREQTLRARQKLIGKLPITGELLRGSLLERTVRHTKDCPKCARGEGHHVFCFDGDVREGTHASVQRAPRAGCRGAPLAERLIGEKLKAIPSEQNHGLVAAKIFFKWAVRNGYIDQSPCESFSSFWLMSWRVISARFFRPKGEVPMREPRVIPHRSSPVPLLTRNKKVRNDIVEGRSARPCLSESLLGQQFLGAGASACERDCWKPSDRLPTPASRKNNEGLRTALADPHAEMSLRAVPQRDRAALGRLRGSQHELC